MGETIPDEELPGNETPAYVISGEMALAGDTPVGETLGYETDGRHAVGETLADETGAQLLALMAIAVKGESGMPARRLPEQLCSCCSTQPGWRSGRERAVRTSQGEGVPVSTTQGELPGVPGGGEGAADGSADVDGNAGPGGQPDGQRDSLPIRLQSSDIALDRPIEPGEDIAEAVAEELRQRGRLGAGDSLANASGPRELGETTVLRMRQEHQRHPGVRSRSGCLHA